MHIFLPNSIQGKNFKTQLASVALVLMCGWECVALAKEEVSADNKIELLSAYEGNPESQFKLALRYSKSSDDIDKKQAFYWYKQAARQGNANAQYNLGHFYYKGVGTKKNQSKTVFWWLKSANQRYLPAQNNMGLANANGIGMDKNIGVAQQWFTLCAEAGSSQCKNNLTKLIHAQTQTRTVPSAWVYKSYTSIEDKQVTLTGDKVRAREKPVILSNNVIKELSVDSTFQFIEENKKWVHIQLGKPVSIAKKAKPELNPLKLSKKAYKGSYSFKDKRSDDDWLFSLANDAYTIQLNSFDTQEKINSFIEQKGFSENKELRLLLTKRHSIEWKYSLFGSFTDKEKAMAAIKENKFHSARIVKAVDIQQVRCSAWKTTLPPPKKLDQYCVTSSN